jgi:radical SAM protein with 4Fe4S-binding SPASM domain
LRLCLRLRRLRLRLRRRGALVSLPVFRKSTKTRPEPGLYAYDLKSQGGLVQVHLRVHRDGFGTLLINANQVLHLNPSACLMAWLILEGLDPNLAIKEIRRQYRVDQTTAVQDYQSFQSQLQALLDPNAGCFIHDYELELLPPFSSTPDAPYRMDLALTYRCNENCAHCYNARPRNYPELPTAEWKKIIDRLWELGIPHICFTGGEATLRPDLPELVSYAEAKGQITGLLTNGRRLSNPDYLRKLRRAGLDHVQITIESSDPSIHDRMVGRPDSWQHTVQGIRNALEQELFVMTNTTLLELNAKGLGETIEFLAQLGVPTIGCNALIYAGKGSKVDSGIPEDALPELLQVARRKTDEHGQRLIWYTPTQYCHFDPVQMELGIKGCTAARYNMCVEPDGGVIPCQSFYHPVGNVLTDTWESIWEHELSLWLRNREYLPEGCLQCPVIAECGGGCPLSLGHLVPTQMEIVENALESNR